MPLYEPSAIFPPEKPRGQPVNTRDNVPKEMNIFWRDYRAFLPEGKTIDELTPDELKKLKAQCRFDPMVPGEYQGITGFGHMI